MLRFLSRRLLWTLAGIELLWLVLGNVALNTSFGQYLANLRAEKFELSWDGGWTLYPMRFEAREVRMAIHTWTTDTTLAAGRVTGNLQLLPLLAGKFVFDGVHADSLVVEIERERPTGERPPPSKPYPGPMLVVRNASVGVVESVRFNRWQVRGGNARALGSAGFRIRGDKNIDHVEASWRNAEILIDGERLPETVDFGVTGAVSAFNPRIHRGRELAQKISGRLTVTGEVSTLVPLQFFFPGHRWIEGIDGDGAVAVDVRLDTGRLQPGTTVDVEARHLQLDFLGYRARGIGRVSGSVAEADDGPVGELELRFDDYDLLRRGVDVPLVHGSDLSLRSRALAPGSQARLDDLGVVLDLPAANIPDVTLLNRYLPPTLGLSIDSGSARLEGGITIAGAERSATARLSVSGESLGGRFRDTAFNMDFSLDSEATGQQLDDFTIDLGGTSLRLFNGTFNNGKVAVDKNWWMDVDVPAGEADMSKPFAIEAEVEMAMKDTRAIIALFAEVKDWVRRFDGFLTVENVAGTARVAVADRWLRVRDLAVQGDRLDLVAEVAANGERNDAVVWGKLGPFSGGFERVGGERRWKLINGRKWFERRKREHWSGSEAAAEDRTD